MSFYHYQNYKLNVEKSSSLLLLILTKNEKSKLKPFCLEKGISVPKSIMSRSPPTHQIPCTKMKEECTSHLRPYTLKNLHLICVWLIIIEGLKTFKKLLLTFILIPSFLLQKCQSWLTWYIGSKHCLAGKLFHWNAS